MDGWNPGCTFKSTKQAEKLTIAKWRFKDEGWWMKYEGWRLMLKVEGGFIDKQTDGRTFMIVESLSWLKRIDMSYPCLWNEKVSIIKLSFMSYRVRISIIIIASWNICIVIHIRYSIDLLVNTSHQTPVIVDVEMLPEMLWSIRLQISLTESELWVVVRPVPPAATSLFASP